MEDINKVKTSTALLVKKMRETVHSKQKLFTQLDENLEIVQRDLIPHLELLEEQDLKDLQIALHEEVKILIELCSSVGIKDLNKINAQIELIKRA